MRILVVVSIIMALGLGACGRRASLDAPPDPAKQGKPATFVLDGLIKGV